VTPAFDKNCMLDCTPIDYRVSSHDQSTRHYSLLTNRSIANSVPYHAINPRPNEVFMPQAKKKQKTI
jgi:hypothetical protein